MDINAEVIAVFGSILVALISAAVAIVSLRQSRKTAFDLEAVQDSRTKQSAFRALARHYAEMLGHAASAVQRIRDDLRDIDTNEISMRLRALEKTALDCDSMVGLYSKELVQLPEPDRIPVHQAKEVARKMVNICHRVSDKMESIDDLILYSEPLRSLQSKIIEYFRKWEALSVNGEDRVDDPTNMS